jgi:hypothetical protein
MSQQVLGAGRNEALAQQHIIIITILSQYYHNNSIITTTVPRGALKPLQCTVHIHCSVQYMCPRSAQSPNL